MLDVIFYEAFEEEQAALKAIIPKGIRAGFTWKTIQESEDKTLPAKVICVRTQSFIPKEWAQQMRGILTRSQGYDHLIAYRKAAQTDLPCGYLGSYCSRAVAEQAILSMLALQRKLTKQIKQFDTFHRDGLTGVECTGKNALVVGVGRIGSEIVDIAQGLRMNVKGVDIDPQNKEVAYVDLEEGILWADVIFSAVPLTEGTQGMFHYDCLSQAKKGAVFINISRGETSPVKDLKRLLEEGELGALSLDVFEDEKILADILRKNESSENETVKTIFSLKDKENVLFTPHNAFNTEESVKEKAKKTIASLVSFLEKNEFIHAVPDK